MRKLMTKLDLEALVLGELRREITDWLAFLREQLAAEARLHRPEPGHQCRLIDGWLFGASRLAETLLFKGCSYEASTQAEAEYKQAKVEIQKMGDVAAAWVAARESL